MKDNKTNTDINNSTNNTNVIGNNKDFNYEDFKKESIKKLYEGKGLTEIDKSLGKRGVAEVGLFYRLKELAKFYTNKKEFTNFKN